jgi:hypothetical protein
MSTLWQPPLTPLAARGSLSERLLSGPERAGHDGREATQTQQQSCWRASPSQPLKRPLLHQLLNNPPPARVSPSTAEQWHHDVDQIIIAAINMPHRDGRRQPFA